MGKKSRGQRPVATTSRLGGELDGLLALIQQLMQDRQFGEAMRAGRTLVEKYPLEPRAHAVFGAVLTDLGNPAEGLRQFEMAQRLGLSDDVQLLRNIVIASTSARMPVHAARAARVGMRAYIASRQDAPEVAGLFSTVLSSTEQYIHALLEATDHNPDVAEEALHLMEQSTQALALGDPERAQHLAEDASTLIPAWPLPWNNLASIRFTLNDIPGALAACNEVLESRDTTNAMVLSTVVRLLAVTGQQDEAIAALERLLAVSAASAQIAEEQAKALAICGRDQQVHDLLAPFNAKGELHGVGKYLLGVAAANCGNSDEARAAWRNLHTQGLTQARFYSDVVLRKEKPATPSGKFTYFAAAELVPSVVLDELASHVHVDRNRDRLRQVAASYPFLPEALCETFYAQGLDARLAVDLLLPLRELKPTIVDAIRTFATGRLGTDYQRVYAHIGLRAAGEDDPALPASVWLGGRRRELVLPALELTLPEQQEYDPKVRELLNRGAEAQEREDSAGAAEIYRQLLEIDPNMAEAEHNLGTALLLTDDFTGGADHLRRALELNPDHVLARCNLAAMSLMGSDLETARALVGPLEGRRSFSLEEAIAYLRTRADIARAEGDPATAEALLQALLAYDPENRLARERLTALASSAAPAAG